MKKVSTLLTSLLLFLIAAQAQKKPNFLVILVDDMGYSDLGCYGGEIDTRNLGGITANGLRFTQF